MARAGKRKDPRGQPWLLLAPLPLTVGAAVGAAWLQLSPPLLLALWLVLGAASAGIVARAWRAMTGEAGVVWEKQGVVEFDARRVVALDANGEEIESTARGRG